jgi:hypothetical protein
MTEINPPSLPEPVRRFGASARALGQRVLLLRVLKGLLLACLLLLAWKFQPPMLWLNLLKWILVAGMAWGLWQAQGEAVRRPLAERELRLHEHALELGRGDFKRLLVFESLRHIHAVQAKGGGRFHSIRLDTDDDSVLLRDLDGLPEAFAALAARKPDRCLIEIEEKGVDWGEPLPWALALGAAAVLLGLLMVLGLESDTLRASAGRLMMADGLALGAWRPLGRGQRWPAVGGEILGLVLLSALGYMLA